MLSSQRLKSTGRATALGDFADVTNFSLTQSTKPAGSPLRPAGPAALRADAPSALQLSLGAVGVDNGGGWFCHNKNTGPCFYADVVSLVDGNDTLPSRFAQYRYAGPVYAALDLQNVPGAQLHYNMDGSDAVCGGGGARACSFYHGGDLSVQVARAVSYGGKTRVVLYAASSAAEQTQGWVDGSLPDASKLPPCWNLALWVCGSDSVPNLITVINVTDALSGISKFQLTQSIYDNPSETLGPLEPGPIVRVKFLVAKRFTSANLSSIARRVCAAVWNVSGDSEQCEWQIWAALEAGTNVEVWSDADRRWVASSNGMNAKASVWTVSLTLLAESNSFAAWARYRTTREVNSADFVREFQVVSMVNVTTSGDGAGLTNNRQYFAHVMAPAPANKRGVDSIYGCMTHYECGSGLFCSYFALRTWNNADVYVGSMAACEDCRTCFDADQYTIDGSCPEDKCGPRVGTYPKCWDAQKLLGDNSCQSAYELNLSTIPGMDQGAADVSSLLAKPPTLRARFLTPFNRLVGAVIIRQKRTQQASTISSGNVCSLLNDSIARYSSTADQSRGLICLGDLPDNSFFGTDPAFAQYSSLYDGKLNPLDFYNASEFPNSSIPNPFGFFPHRYDLRSGKDKIESLFSSEADNFLVFLDEHISSSHAQKIITYLNDGNFLDQQTNEITVEMNTLNAASKMYCKFTFTFKWQVLCLPLVFLSN